MRRLRLLVAAAVVPSSCWLACVGDDPQPSSQSDSGQPSGDSAPGNETGAQDSGTDTASLDGSTEADAGPQCLDKTLAYYKGDDTANDFFNTLPLTTTTPAGFDIGIAGKAFKPNAGYFRSAADTTAFGGHSDFSVEFWIKYPAEPTNARRVLDYGNASINGNVWMVQTNAGTDTLNFSINNAGIVSAHVLQNGAFHHVAFVVDNGKTPKGYVDGVLQPEGGNSGTLPPAQGASKLTIGADAVGAYPFNGLIDELALYARVLSEAEVKAIFNAGAAGHCRKK